MAMVIRFLLANLVLFSMQCEAIAQMASRHNRSALTVGPLHPGCREAFQKLPIDQYGRAIEAGSLGQSPRLVNEGDLPAHYARHRSAYQAHDVACFQKWEDLKPVTRMFLGDNAGALFDSRSGHPVCSAFLINERELVTAAHCLGQTPLMHFRLFGVPNVVIELKPFSDAVIGTSSEAVSSQDLSDIARLPLETPLPGRTYRWTEADVTRVFREPQSIVVVAISIPAYQLGELTPPRWREAVRFSRVNASQILPMATVRKAIPSDEAARYCIVHTAPTYPGMSGAAIIGVQRLADDPSQGRLFLMGMHLRNGVAGDESIAKDKHSCGQHSTANVGLRILPSMRGRMH